MRTEHRIHLREEWTKTGIPTTVRAPPEALPPYLVVYPKTQIGQSSGPWSILFSIYSPHFLCKIYWVRLKCFYVVARFSANFYQRAEQPLIYGWWSHVAGGGCSEFHVPDFCKYCTQRPFRRNRSMRPQVIEVNQLEI